ncbi:binary toxin-like calcium binding domain-containing protein [Salinithrix halophila]|uniref:binary toxin-like calcium binding domain-containing protein n=1 Tax=Salinithrix halophila TaxID=1485204 RepID=UPI0036D39AAC
MKNWAARSLLWISALSLLVSPQMVFADNQGDKEDKPNDQTACKDDQKKPTGDCDGDKISNELETSGFKIADDGFGKKVEKWNPGDEAKRYVTNPLSANSDGDPYSDHREVFGKLPPDVQSPGDDPMIAAYPKVEVQLKKITVTPIQTITDTEGGSITKSWSTTTTDRVDVGGSLTAGADEKGANVGGSLSLGYSHETSNTNGEDKQINWQKARTADTSKAAQLQFHVQYKNTGLASAGDVSPTFNLKLGDELLGTVKAEQERYKANLLTTKKGGNNTHEVLIDSVDTRPDVKITISLDQLKAFQQGVPLVLEHTATKMSLKKKNDKGVYEHVGNWADYQSDIHASTSRLVTDIGDVPETRMYVPSSNVTTNFLSKVFLGQIKSTDHMPLSVQDFMDHSQINFTGAKHFIHLNRLKNVDKTTFLTTGSSTGIYKEIKKPKVSWVYYNTKNRKLQARFTPGTLGLTSPAIYDPDGLNVKMSPSSAGSFNYVSNGKVDKKAISDAKWKKPKFKFQFGEIDKNCIIEGVFNHNGKTPSIIVDNKPGEKQTLVATVTSGSEPQKGQNSRSSGNFSIDSLPAGTKKLKWVVEGEGASSIKYTVKEDKSSANDNVFWESLTNGIETNIKKSRSLYIADPKNATSNFKVKVYAIHPDTDQTGNPDGREEEPEGDLIASVTSETQPQSGQSHRSSGNFSIENLPPGTKKLKWVVKGAEGVKFNIKEDKSVLKDPTHFTGISNGMETDVKQGRNFYIADPSFADGMPHKPGTFTVSVYALY